MPPPLAKALRALLLVAYAGLVVVIFVFAAYLSFNLFVRSGATAIPDLAGLPEAEARGTLSDAGLELRPVAGGGRFDPEVPAGHVVAQHPAPRSLVKRGSAVQVTLSLGPQRLVVPDLVGRSMQTAQVSLAANGLAIGRVLGIFRPGAEAGTVAEQAPVAGASVAPQSAIDLLMVQPGSEPAYVMPDLVYRDYDRVRRFFEGRGFRFGSVKFEPYEGVADGVILRQFPLAGHPLARNAVISLVVATAPALVDPGAVFAPPAAFTP